MNIGTVVGVGIVGTILAITVKNTRPEMGIGVSVLTGCVIFSLVLPYMSQILEELRLLSEKSGLNFGHFVPVVKIIGIAYITQFSAEIIKDSGEGAISKKVELAGKVAILIMLLPILKNLINVIFSTFSVI